MEKSATQEIHTAVFQPFFMVEEKQKMQRNPCIKNKNLTYFFFFLLKLFLLKLLSEHCDNILK